MFPRTARRLLTCALVLVLLAAGQVLASRASVAAVAAHCAPLTVREMAAQTVMTGIPGTSAGSRARALVERDAGAVIVMRRNVTDRPQLTALLSDLRDRARAGLLVAVDEEGGRVSRLAGAGLVDELPSARRLARNETPDQVWAAGRSLGRDLRRLGIDMNLAPVLDVTAAPADTVVGDRSYGADPATVARFGTAFAEGLQDGGVLTAGKHFPGHGRTSVDSHDQLPLIDVPVLDLVRGDLRPFARAMRSLDAVMTAHVMVPALDEDLPASLSPATAVLLRGLYGFDGLLITDALEMGAVTTQWDLTEAAVLAVSAGADVALVAGPGDRTAAVTDGIADAVRHGRISMARLREASGRVLAAKGYPPKEVECLLGSATSDRPEQHRTRKKAPLRGEGAGTRPPHGASGYHHYALFPEA